MHFKKFQFLIDSFVKPFHRVLFNKNVLFRKASKFFLESVMAPLGNNSSTLKNEPCPPSYILQNFWRRKLPVSADFYVNCITELLVFFFNCKKNLPNGMFTSRFWCRDKTNRFALFFGDSVIFFLWFNLLKFLWIYFTEKKSRQNLIL